MGLPDSAGLGAAAMIDDALVTCEVRTAGLAEGAVVCWDAVDKKNCVAPGGAGATKVRGVLYGQQGSSTSVGSTAVGDVVTVQQRGTARVLLGATLTVAAGDPVIVSNTSGHVKALGAETVCSILGYALESKTAGAAAEMISVRLNIHHYAT